MLKEDNRHILLLAVYS